MLTKKPYQIIFYFTILVILGVYGLFICVIFTGVISKIRILGLFTISYFIWLLCSNRLTILAAKGGMLTPVTDGMIIDTIESSLALAGLNPEKVKVFFRPKRSIGRKPSYYAGAKGYLDYYLILDGQLVKELEKDELTAIIYHEIHHIKHRDLLRISLCWSITVFLPYIFGLFGSLTTEKVLSNSLHLIGIIGAVTMFFLTLYYSRNLEYKADLYVKRMMGQAYSLETALSKLTIMSGLKPDVHWIRKILGTHPTLAARINKLSDD